MLTLPELIDILTNLMSGNNEIRQQAENCFLQQQDQNLFELISLLLEVLRNSSIDLVIRSLSGILLRRILDSGTAHGNKVYQDQASLFSIRNNLLDIWSHEMNSLILRRLAHILAQIASNGNWMELIPSLLSHGATLEGNSLIALLNLIEIIAEYCPDDVLTHLSSLVSFLGPHLIQNDPRIQIACAKAVGACIVSARDEGARETFKPALQLIVRTLGNALNQGDELDAVTIMEYLVNIAQHQPMFFKGSMDHIVEAMVTVAASQGLDFPTRSIAVELMVTLTETAPALARRCTGLVNGLVPLAMNLMLELEETDEEWAAQEYTEEFPDESAIVGEEAIERAAAGVGRALVPPVVQAVQEYSNNSSDSRFRRAAVAALSRLAEGSTEIFKKEYFEASLPFFGTCLSDPSPRVQYQAIQAIGQFATLYPKFIPRMIHLYFDHLVDFMGNVNHCDRVRGHAISALINLCRPQDDEDSEGNETQQHQELSSSDSKLSPEQIDQLLTVLCNAMQTTSIHVQPPCLLLLGCVARSNRDNFIPYYPMFMPGIKSIMREACAPQFELLRGKAMECVGIIGEAVGDEVFAADALEVMELLIHSISEGDDTTYDHILPACARIAKALQEKFQPFLSYVMGPVLDGANQILQFSMVDAEDGDTLGEVVFDEETGLESAVVALGPGVKKRVSLNTHALQQKNQCTKMIYEYASSLQGTLGDYITPCLEVVLNLVTDKHSSDLRFSASHAIPALFKAALDASCRLQLFPITQMQSLLEMILMKLMEAITGEINATARECAVEALRDVIEICYESGTVQNSDGIYSNWQICLPSLDMSLTILKELLLKCQESLLRRGEKERAILRNEGLDAEDRDSYAVELEVEEDLITAIIQTISEFFKIHRSELMPFVDQHVAPHFASYLSPTQPQALQVIAVCLLDDILEFGGPEACQKFLPHVLSVFIQNLKPSTALLLRQCSCYGLAQALRNDPTPSICEAYLETLVPALIEVVTADEAQEEENEGLTENAVFALGFILLSPTYRSHIPPETLMKILLLWLDSLPLTADFVESKISLRQLCELLESPELSAVVLGGSEFRNLPTLLRIFADIFLTVSEMKNEENANDPKNCLVHLETYERIKRIYYQFQQTEEISSCIRGGGALGQLTDEQQQILQSNLP